MLGAKEKKFKNLGETRFFARQNALITGAASGIGKAIAYRFAEAGADLELVDIAEERLETTSNELAKLNVRINIHKVDLSSKSEVDQLWSKLEGKGPDILVNNAGIYPLKDFLEVGGAFCRKFWMSI